MKHYSPTGRRNHGRPLKGLLDTWDWNGSTSGPTPWQIDNDDDENTAMPSAIPAIKQQVPATAQPPRLTFKWYYTW
jgi:hypothetical protein